MDYTELLLYVLLLLEINPTTLSGDGDKNSLFYRGNIGKCQLSVNKKPTVESEMGAATLGDRE